MLQNPFATDKQDEEIWVSGNYFVLLNTFEWLWCDKPWLKVENKVRWYCKTEIFTLLEKAQLSSSRPTDIAANIQEKQWVGISSAPGSIILYILTTVISPLFKSENFSDITICTSWLWQFYCFFSALSLEVSRNLEPVSSWWTATDWELYLQSIKNANSNHSIQFPMVNAQKSLKVFCSYRQLPFQSILSSCSLSYKFWWKSIPLQYPTRVPFHSFTLEQQLYLPLDAWLWTSSQPLQSG